MGVGASYTQEQLTPVRQSYNEVVAELTADLLDLIELGAYDAASDLAVRYRFYHAHGALIVAFLEQERYDEAHDALHDLLAGPLRERALSEFTNRCFDELLYIPRMLFLLSIVQQQYYVRDIDPMTRLLIEGYRACPTFTTFVERWEQKREVVTSEAYGVAVVQQLLHYALLLDAKLRQWYEVHPWSPSVTTMNFASPQHERAYALYEIIDVCYASTEDTQMTCDSVVAVALNNLSEYAHGEAPVHYRQTTAKLDVQTVAGALPVDDAVELLTRAELFDAHLKLSLDCYVRGDILTALRIVHSFAEYTTVTRTSGNFHKELLRKTIFEYMLHMLSLLDQAGRDAILSRVAGLIPSEYAPLCRRIAVGDEIVCSDAVAAVREMSDELISSPRLIF